MSGRMLSERRRIEVEQGIARGWSTKHIADVVGCTVQDVIRVARALDVINNAPDVIPSPRKKSRTASPETRAVTTGVCTSSFDSARPVLDDQDMTDGRDALAEAMRFEQARIYGQLQPEHRNGAA